MLTQGDLTKRYRIRAVERALVLLRSFLSIDSDLSAAEVGKRVGLDPSTAFRMLVTLEDHGFVRQDAATGRYRLGVVCLELGSQFLKTSDVRGRALDTMHRLRDRFGETVHLGVLDGFEIVYLERVPGLHAIGLMSSRVGGRAPAHATAIGKVLLAHFPDEELRDKYDGAPLRRFTSSTVGDWAGLESAIARVRADGFAIDNQEFEAGVKCVAVPIFSHKGIAAGLSISGPQDRMNEHIEKHGLVDELRRASAAVSAESGWGRGVDQIGRPGLSGLAMDR